jgi:hypothetical protein
VTLPSFTKDGVLPPGDYPLMLEQLKESHLVTGQGNRSRTWDRNWRRLLAGNLEIMVRQLWQVGIDRIFVDGSFVEDKDHPHDIDGYFECSLLHFATQQLHRELNALDPYKIWTWDPNSRRPAPNSAKKQLPMWHQYRVELYPHYAVGAGFNLTGIKDEFGNDQPFPAAFRKSRTANRPKGIVQIVKTMPDEGGTIC